MNKNKNKEINVSTEIKKKDKVNFLKKVHNLILASAGLLGVSMLNIQNVYGTKINPNLTTESAIGSLIDMVIQIAFYVGVMFAVWGFIQFVLSFTNMGNEEKRTSALVQLIVGAVLIGVRMFLEGTILA